MKEFDAIHLLIANRKRVLLSFYLEAATYNQAFQRNAQPSPQVMISKDFEELLKKLEAAGIEVNQERKYLRFRLSPEDRYSRCDTLKGDYTEQAIKERIAGTRTVKKSEAKRS